MKKYKIYLTEFTIEFHSSKREDLIYAGLTILAENAEEARKMLDGCGMVNHRIINP